jgi:hypothetical protein
MICTRCGKEVGERIKLIDNNLSLCEDCLIEIIGNVIKINLDNELPPKDYILKDICISKDINDFKKIKNIFELIDLDDYD